MEEENNIKKDKIVKSNKVIEAGFSELNRNSFKLLMFLTTEMCMSTLEPKENGCKITFRHSDFTTSLGLEKNSLSYSEIKGFLNELRKATVELPIIEDGKEVGETITGFILKSNVYKRGFSTVLFDEDILSYLHYLDTDGKFTMLRYNMMKEFGSFYSMRIYELLMQWKNTKHKSITFELEELKNKLGAKEKYEDVRDFEKWVLKPTQKEINAVSDILIDYEKLALREKKGKGRKPISHIKFTFTVKADALPQTELLTEKQIKELLKFAESRAIGSDKTGKGFYDYAFTTALEGHKNKNGFYGYMKKVLENDNVFLRQTSMFINPDVRAKMKSNQIHNELLEEQKKKTALKKAEIEAEYEIADKKEMELKIKQAKKTGEIKSISEILRR